MRTLCFHPCATAAMRDRAHRIANEMATERGALPDKLFVEDLCLEVESAGLGDAHILQRGSFISVVVQDIPLLTWYPGITEALPKAAPKADHHSPITVAQAATSTSLPVCGRAAWPPTDTTRRPCAPTSTQAYFRRCLPRR